MFNLTYKILELVLPKMGLDMIQQVGEISTFQYFVQKNIEKLFGKDSFSNEEIKLKPEINNIVSFLYNGEKYTFFIEENHLILKKNFNEIVFRITIKEHSIANFLIYKNEDKTIQEYQTANLKEESFKYHRVNSSATQDVYSVTLKATRIDKKNSMQDKFRITYAYPEECKKTTWEMYWDTIRKNNIFIIPILDVAERLNIIFNQLEERCSKEYTRIKLK